MNRWTEEQLIAVYREQAPKLYKYCLYKFLNKEIAQDMVSEVFTRFVAEAQSGKEIEDQTQFLYGIARNIAMDFLREKYQQNAVPLVEDMASDVAETLNTLGAAPNLEDIAAPFITKLPKQQAKILQLRLIDKMSLDEIAAQIGKDRNYVKVNQHRGIKRLKELIACTPLLTNKRAN